MFNRNTRGIWSWFVEEDISLNNGSMREEYFHFTILASVSGILLIWNYINIKRETRETLNILKELILNFEKIWRLSA